MLVVDVPVAAGAAEVLGAFELWPVAFITRFREPAVAQFFEHRTAHLLHVEAVAELAGKKIALEEPGEDFREGFRVHVHEADAADTRGIDDIAAARQIEKARRNRRVASLAVLFAHGARLKARIGNERIYESRLANTTLTAEYGGFALELGFQRFKALPVLYGNRLRK